MKFLRSPIILSTLALILSLIAMTLQVMLVTGRLPTPGMQGGQDALGASPEISNARVAADKEETASDQASESEQSLEDQSKRIAFLERQVAALSEVVRSSGLDAAAPFLQGPPGSSESLLAGIGEKYATRARFEESRKRRLEHASEMRRRDQATYGDESYKQLEALYKKALPRRGNETEAERTERESALSTLMTDYSESWSTSVAVAEQALDAAMNRNLDNVEQYYDSLVSTSPYSDVVTDQGIDAVPTLQTYLARQYIQEGRYDEASTMIDALSTHADSVIMEPNEMGEATATSVQDIVTQLRDRVSQ